jgi:hypothetical protein
VRLIKALLARDAKLVLEMDVGGCQEYVYAWPDGSFQGLCRARDIVLGGSG